MIKEFKNISMDDLEVFYKEGFEVEEKFDMYYFRVEITKVGAIAMKGSTENVISDIDCITNKMFKDICTFVDNTINPVRNDIIAEFGELRVGFFYNPGQKYHVIDYSKNENLVNCFIVNDILSYDGKEMNRYKLNTYFKLYLVPPFKLYDEKINWKFGPKANTIINKYEHEIEIVKPTINEYLKDDKHLMELVELLSYSHTPSHLSCYSVEGLILRSCESRITYQITVNDVNSHEVDKNTKLIYRDTVLQSLVNTIQTKKEGYSLQGFMPFIYKNDMTYVDKVSNLFLFYIENTDLFSKYSFDPEDLLPPHIGYIGDVDLDIIPNQNVKILCMHNEVNKNIFRLFLHTFSRNLSENKFSSFVDEDRKFLNELVILLKYKNYKQIMLTAYKANKNKR